MSNDLDLIKRNIDIINEDNAELLEELNTFATQDEATKEVITR